MQAFKLYFKIFKNSALPSALIYIIIFSALCIIFVQSSSNDATTAFSIDKRNVAVINNDNSDFSKELEKYIGENTKVKKIDTSEDAIKDALFYRKVEYVVTIPQGFGDAFLAKNPIALKTTSIPNSTSSAFIDMMIDKYLQAYNMYQNGSGSMSFNEILSHVKQDLSKTVDVNMTRKSTASQLTSLNSYVNYANYPIMCILILSVGLVLFSVNQTDIKRRNLCSPLNQTKFSLQIFFGNIFLMLFVFALFAFYAFVMFPQAVKTTNGLLMLINMLIISLVALSLSFMIGNFAGRRSLQPICNTLSLGFCFLGGAFVPQELLSDSVKNFALINPVYWFIKANNEIITLSNFDFEDLKPVYINMGIELIYAIAFIAITLLIIKQKRTKS